MKQPLSMKTFILATAFVFSVIGFAMIYVAATTAFYSAMEASIPRIAAGLATNGTDVSDPDTVEQSLTPLRESAQWGLLKNLLLMAPFPFLLSVLVVRFLSRRINQSVNIIEASIDQVNKVSDLTQLKLLSKNTGFKELNRIMRRIEQLGSKVKSVAVDKDLLEFEIRLLEKFVITSEVVKDWREYVAALLLEINQVIHAYNIFSIFKVDDELFDLEIFWVYPPCENTKRQLEQQIRKELDLSPHFRGIGTLEINHNISDHNGPTVTLRQDELEVQTKSLLVETPRIGGIVGIGVHSDIVKDQTRVLVMESILSTLLNVVGSVKAIYKYTKDLEYYATRDPLTDLYNQRLFWELLGYEVGRSDRHNCKFTLLIIDLDNFKSINDSYGHGMGDKYLQEFATTLQQSLRAGDILARYGGDEFVVILPESDVEQATWVCERIIDNLARLEVTTPDDKKIRDTVSIGMSVYPDHAQNTKDLFMFADNIMYKAKNQGKNRVCIPTEEDVVAVFRDMSEKSLLINKAITERRVIPFFQPIMDVDNNTIGAVEILSRIELENNQLMGAHEFIQIAESMGVIHNLDYIVMEKAFAVINAEQFDGLIFINLSPRSLVLKEFIPRVKTLVETADIDPERIVFEITERDTVKNLAMLSKFVTNLKAEGFKLAVDDFGSGFSSFHYLKHFPIDFVKIEGEFVVNMTHNEKDRSVVRCIANLAKDLGAKTVAEFVENEEVIDAVAAIGIDYAQGYHIRRPGPSIYTHPTEATPTTPPQEMA